MDQKKSHDEIPARGRAVSTGTSLSPTSRGKASKKKRTLPTCLYHMGSMLSNPNSGDGFIQPPASRYPLRAAKGTRNRHATPTKQGTHLHGFARNRQATRRAAGSGGWEARPAALRGGHAQTGLKRQKAARRSIRLVRCVELTFV